MGAFLVFLTNFNRSLLRQHVALISSSRFQTFKENFVLKWPKTTDLLRQDDVAA